jgi:4-aminobutyrate aminotransferase-like enzyme
VSQILKDYDILLISDEVQNGFCRTGKFWGVDNFALAPDLLYMGKGINSMYLPLGAVAVSDRVFKGIQGHEFVGGGTSCGDAAALASGLAALKIYQQEKLDQRAAELGEHARQRLVEEFLPLPCVDDVMGKGLYQSFEIALNKTTGSRFNPAAQAKVREEVFWKLIESGVFARIDHDRRVYFTPPLTITAEELDQALDILLRTMKEVKPL